MNWIDAVQIAISGIIVISAIVFSSWYAYEKAYAKAYAKGYEAGYLLGWDKGVLGATKGHDLLPHLRGGALEQVTETLVRRLKKEKEQNA